MILSSSHRPEAALQQVEIRKPGHQQPSTQCKDATQLSSLCSQFLLSKRWLCGLFLPASFERRFISEMRNASVAPVVWLPTVGLQAPGWWESVSVPRTDTWIPASGGAETFYCCAARAICSKITCEYVPEGAASHTICAPRPSMQNSDRA